MAEVMNIIGTVQDKRCLIVDDMVDTAGTMCKGAAALKEHGASWVSAYITHPVLSGPAIDNISSSEIDELVVTDTIPLSEDAVNCRKIRVISVAEMLAESMRRINLEESISCLFEE